MSRIRDIANLFSANTDAATDAEVASAISSHNTTANGHVKRGNTASRPASPSNGDVYANTETGYFEHYDGTSWTAVAVAASTPSSVVATNQGSGRSFNNGQASVAFTAGTIAGSTYTVTSSPGSYTATGSSSPLVVTGLQSSTQYTYTVVAANKWGTSSASSASTGVTATTVPQAPTIDSVTSSGGNSAIITFTAGATGGSAITQYTITSSPSTTTQTTSSSPYTFTGLTLGQSYTFTMTATNANGTSASTTSSSVTIEELDTGAMFPIFATTLTTATNTLTFSNIPQTYTHLQLIYTSRVDANGNMACRFNSDTGNNYDTHYMYSNSSPTTGAGAEIGVSRFYVDVSTVHSNAFTIGTMDILDYRNTNKYKVARSLATLSINQNTSPAAYTWTASGLWRNSNAITSMTLFATGSENYQVGSSFALYGIKGA